jgi:hypothetical protein
MHTRMPSPATLPETANSYVPHALHGENRTWPEAGGQIDVWIEVLHSQGVQPLAALAFTLALDYEGDQFTCVGFPRADLRVLYGIEVQELTVWRPLVAHAAQQAALGRVVMVDADAFFLPDTVGTAYRYEHAVTTIGIVSIDAEREQLRYFHGRGQHTLGGNDFAGVFRTGPYVADATVLPPPAEIAKLDGMADLDMPALVERATSLARLHLAGAPPANPIARWADRTPRDLAWLRDDPRAPLQRYALVTARQVGVCAGLTAAFLEWLDANGNRRVLDVAAAFDRVSRAAKSAHLKLVRMSRTRAPADITSDLATMVASWEEGMSRLTERLAR